MLPCILQGSSRTNQYLHAVYDGQQSEGLIRLAELMILSNQKLKGPESICFHISF